MQKRNKRLMDYVRFKAIKDRGDKPDKKTTEQGEQFVALNITLKEELPKLFALTAKLMEACLNNFIQIQKTWLSLIEKKLGYTIDRLPQELGQIISDWSGDFSFSEAQVLSLGICNGSMLAEVFNQVPFGTPASNGVDLSSPRQSTTVSSSTGRTLSRDNSGSPKVSHDFSIATSRSSIPSPHSDNFTQHSNGSHVFAGGRRRANSGAQTIPPVSSLINSSSRPGTSKGSGSARAALASPSLPQLTLDTPKLHELLASPLAALSNSGALPDAGDLQMSPIAGRYSGFFSSAMPMESPVATTRAEERTLKDPSVMFPAASMFEFNIDRSRREAGYPYLTYVAGEIFDVIGEKGDLWLARNQDDPTHQVGWIWTKHFAKLTT
jgi:hypothetical protein